MEESFYSEIKECGCELLEKLLPRVVVFSHDAEEIQRLIALAVKRRLRICPTGTGTSFAANYQPPDNTIFILTLGLNHPVEIRPLDSVVVAGAGLVVRELITRLEGSGIALPMALADYRGTLGGAVLGPDITGIRHSAVKRRLLGLEMIDSRGRVLKFGGATIKNVAGYDFWTFLVGTCGRFGVVSRVILNLEKVPTSGRFRLRSKPFFCRRRGSLDLC